MSNPLFHTWLWIERSKAQREGKKPEELPFRVILAPYLHGAPPRARGRRVRGGAAKAQQLSRRVVEGFLDGFDLLLTPTMACLPPLVGAWRAGTDDDPLRALLNSYPMGVFTSVFNVTGQPAISLPIHHDEATGLPVGVQIVAAPWREDLLLQVSRALELAHPWTGRRPPVS